MTIDPVSLAITAALTAAQMAMTASQKIEGPRLDDLSVTVADYGTPLNYFYGVRRFEGVPIIWAEPLREVKKRRKTKGGKYNEYTYYGTWAIAIAGHQIDGVTRIWFDKHLVYDATGAGPISPFSLKKGFGIADHIRFYLGTEDQTPDPRMLATVEAEHGAGSCPAYRGTAYAVFEDIPLEKLGNRIPQITIEAVAHGTPNYPWETFDVDVAGNRLWGFTYSPDGSRMMWGQGSAYELWDVAARSRMMAGPLPFSIGLQDVVGVANNGSIYVIRYPDDGAAEIVSFRPDFAGLVGTVGSVPYASGLRILQDGNGFEHIVTLGTAFIDYFFTVSLGGIGNVVTYDTDFIGDGSSWTARGACTDSYGDIWVVGSKAGFFGSWDDLFLYRVVDTGARPGSSGFVHLNTGSLVDGASTEIAHYDGHFIVHWDNALLIKIEDETMSIVATAARTGDFYNNPKQWANLYPGSSSIWLNSIEISLSTLAAERNVAITDWKAEDADGIIYDSINHALICFPQFDTLITWRYLDRIGSDGLTLGDIADDVATRCGLPLGGYDFSGLDQVVTGYNWTQGSGRDILDPLFTAYDSDIAPHDFTVRGVKRGAASSGTIDVAQFVRDPERYSVSITQDADLPRALTFSFADTGAEQQTNSVLVQRPSVAIDGVRELNINMTSLAMSVDDARELAERYFRRLWAGRERIDNVLTAQYLSLEPADVRTLALDGISRTARLLEQTITAGGTIKGRWERDDPSIALLSGATGATMDGRAPSVMLVPGLTRGFILDVPLARDIDDQAGPFMLIAAAPYSSSVFWSGADFYFSEDDTADSYDAGWATVGPLDACTWGYTTVTLGDALPWVPDYGSSLNVNLRVGELESVSDADFDASDSLNLALIESAGGWEYIRFRTATLEADGSYTLTGLSRGCRGTEQWIAGHSTGDRFLLVDSSLSKKMMGAGDIGDTDYYKAVSQGRDDTSAYAESVAFSAAAQKPYAPVHGELVNDSGSGDWSIDAVRRTRIGGGNVDGTDVPLGETVESWSCDIMDGADVVRTITGSSLPLAYSSADQTIDFGAPQTTLTVNLYQVSPPLSLRGFPLEIAS